MVRLRPPARRMLRSLPSGSRTRQAGCRCRRTSTAPVAFLQRAASHKPRQPPHEGPLPLRDALCRAPLFKTMLEDEEGAMARMLALHTDLLKPVRTKLGGLVTAVTPVSDADGVLLRDSLEGGMSIIVQVGRGQRGWEGGREGGGGESECRWGMDGGLSSLYLPQVPTR